MILYLKSKESRIFKSLNSSIEVNLDKNFDFFKREIIQTILKYDVPNKTTVELQAIAKTMFDGIAEGASINAKILGETSRFTGTASGFNLNGSASATTGAWDYTYTEKDDIDIKLTKVNGKIQLSVSTPINLMFIKRGGAGNPAYPSFSATSTFSLQFSY